MPRPAQNRGFQLGIVLLIAELFFSIGLSNIPPVTLGAILIQVGLYTGYLNVEWSNKSYKSLCLSAHSVIQDGEYNRIKTAPLVHGSDIHLYYNMISLAWKGIVLEKRYGHIGFFFLLVYFTITTSVVYVILAHLASEFLDDWSYSYQCAVGFSGVLFALKVLANHADPSQENRDFGFFTVPKKMAVWAELLLIQLMVPDASFIGHLAGILTGILTLYLFDVSATFGRLAKRIGKYKGTLVIVGFLSLLHFDLISKPWAIRHLLASRSYLVCLSGQKVLKDRDLWKILSGPLEHLSNVHFAVCLLSIIIKLYRFEEKGMKFSKVIALFIASVIGSSIVYVLLTVVASWFSISSRYSLNCVQGLSASMFALKVIVLLDSRSVGPSFLLTAYEIVELLMVAPFYTLLFHISGLLTGVFIFAFTCGTLFPGVGYPLGNERHESFQTGHSMHSDARYSYDYVRQEEIEELRIRRLHRFGYQ